MISITSSANAVFKRFKSLLTKKGRTENGLFSVEGIKSVHDAMSSSYELHALIVSDDFTDIPVCDAPIYVMPRGLIERLSDTKTPQGIAAVLKIKPSEDFTPSASGAYVYCDGVSDPGNVGTIIRTADAAGMNGVILSEGCADAYAPKTVRASMGSFFHTEIVTGKTAADLKTMSDCGFSIIGGALGENTADFKAVDYKKPLVIVVGNEANGISESVLRLSQCVKIPIFGNAESLNVSVAAGILMYEWARNNLT